MISRGPFPPQPFSDFVCCRGSSEHFFLVLWCLYIPLYQFCYCVWWLNHCGPTSANLCSSFSQSIRFSDAQLLGNSNCRTAVELMPKSKHLLNFETIRHVKAELLKCCSCFLLCLCSPKAQWLGDALVKSDLTKLEPGWLWVQNVYCWLQKNPPVPFGSEFIK